mmetsp:Transcript_30566/g.65870  ORF Transcript_30566/g.65870 Transcript_30566/m.65870 type:complete len:205 (-) Transcript_30566:954-1568(-)
MLVSIPCLSKCLCQALDSTICSKCWAAERRSGNPGSQSDRNWHKNAEKRPYASDSLCEAAAKMAATNVIPWQYPKAGSDETWCSSIVRIHPRRWRTTASPVKVRPKSKSMSCTMESIGQFDVSLTSLDKFRGHVSLASWPKASCESFMIHRAPRTHQTTFRKRNRALDALTRWPSLPSPRQLLCTKGTRVGGGGREDFVTSIGT